MQFITEYTMSEMICAMVTRELCEVETGLC
jgi:hypothetical protein